MLTTAQLASRIGVSPRRLLQLAEARGVAPTMIVGRNKLWHPSAQAKLTPGKRGRPQKDAP